MDDEKQRDTASKGGDAFSGNFKNDPERAAEAGKRADSPRVAGMVAAAIGAARRNGAQTLK
jgi:general stress protein YciG